MAAIRPELAGTIIAEDEEFFVVDLTVGIKGAPLGTATLAKKDLPDNISRLGVVQHGLASFLKNPDAVTEHQDLTAAKVTVETDKPKTVKAGKAKSNGKRKTKKAVEVTETENETAS